MSICCFLSLLVRFLISCYSHVPCICKTGQVFQAFWSIPDTLEHSGTPGTPPQSYRCAIQLSVSMYLFPLLFCSFAAAFMISSATSGKPTFYFIMLFHAFSCFWYFFRDFSGENQKSFNFFCFSVLVREKLLYKVLYFFSQIPKHFEK